MSNILPFPAARTLPGITPPSSSRVKALDEMRSLFDRKHGSPAPTPPPATAPARTTLPTLTIIARGHKALKKLTGFIGPSLRKAVKAFLRGEEGQWFMEKMEELAGRIATMPATHQNRDQTAHLHYFSGGYDYYMLEKDAGCASDSPEEFQSQTYGWARWSHMPDCAEYGYVSLPEILASGAELDLHFTPTPIAECIARFEPEAAADEVSEIQTPSAADHWSELRQRITPKPADNAPAEPVPGALHIRIHRGEGLCEECTTHHYADFATAWECLQAHGQTAPEDGGYDKTDITVTFPDGKEWAYRYDMTHGGFEDNVRKDFLTNLRDRISYYAGRWTPQWMTDEGRTNRHVDQPVPDAVAILETWGHLLGCASSPSPSTPSDPPEIQTPTPEPEPPTPPVNIDRIKEKLAKLLRLGEDTAASEGEIQNALNLATQMMAKHQLTREDIDTSAADPTARVAMGRHFAFCKGANLSTWESQLTHFVKDFIGSVSCYCAGKMPVRKNGLSAEFFGAGQPRMAQAVCFYGSDDDARCAVDLFEELRDAIATMAIARWGGWARGDGFAYAIGFTQGLRDAHKTARANLMNQDEQTHALILKGDSTALAIVNKAKAWLATEHGVRLQSRSSSRSITLNGNKASAMREGRRDGSNYQVTRPGRNKRIG